MANKYFFRRRSLKMSEEQYFSDPKHHLQFLESKIDNDLGFYFWKKYIAAAFWAQMSTPINLAITMLTAVTTAQSTSGGFLSEELYRDISIATLLITVINTFFNPLMQFNKSIEIMKKWNSMGTRFEEIYYDLNKHNEPIEFINKYKELQKDINGLRENEGPENMNFVTDLIHTISVCSCLRGYDKWLSNDRILMKKKIDVLTKRYGISECCDDDGCCCSSNKSVNENAHKKPDPLTHHDIEIGCGDDDDFDHTEYEEVSLSDAQTSTKENIAMSKEDGNNSN